MTFTNSHAQKLLFKSKKSMPQIAIFLKQWILILFEFLLTKLKYSNNSSTVGPNSNLLGAPYYSLRAFQLD